MAKKKIDLEHLPGLKVNEYIALFKKLPQWKKASRIVVLVDYMLDGKKATVILPFKKAADALADFRSIKTKGIHAPAKLALATFSLEKADKGWKAVIGQYDGGLSLDALDKKATLIFSKIHIAVQVKTAAAPDDTLVQEEPDEEEEEEDDNDEDVASEGSIGEETEEETDKPQEKATAKANPVADFKALAMSAKQAVEQFSKEIFPRFQANQSTEADKRTLAAVFETFTTFAKAFGALPAAFQAQAAAIKAAIEKFSPIAQKLLSGGTVPTQNPILAELQAIFKPIYQQVNAAKKSILPNPALEHLPALDKIEAAFAQFQTELAQKEENIRQKFVFYIKEVEEFLAQAATARKALQQQPKTEPQPEPETAKIKNRVSAIRQRIAEITNLLKS